MDQPLDISKVDYPTHRVCVECNDPLPVSLFRVRDKERLEIEKFRDTCHDCRDYIADKRDEARKEAKRQETLDRTTRRKQEEIINKALDVRVKRAGRVQAPDLEAISSAVFEHLGGIDVYAAMLANNVKVAAATDPGGRDTLNSLRLLAQMTTDVSKGRKDRNPLAELSDEELTIAFEATVEQKARELIASQGRSTPAIPSEEEFSAVNEARLAEEEKQKAFKEEMSKGGVVRNAEGEVVAESVEDLTEEQIRKLLAESKDGTRSDSASG